MLLDHHDEGYTVDATHRDRGGVEGGGTTRVGRYGTPVSENERPKFTPNRLPSYPSGSVPSFLPEPVDNGGQEGTVQWCPSDTGK